MSAPPVLTGDPRTDRALIALTRLLAEIAANPRAEAPKPKPTDQDKRDGE